MARQREHWEHSPEFHRARCAFPGTLELSPPPGTDLSSDNSAGARRDSGGVSWVTLLVGGSALATVSGLAFKYLKGLKGIGAADKLGIPKFLNDSRQDVHLGNVADGRSVLTGDPSTLLDDLHSGAFTILRQPKPGQVIVDFGKPIGSFWSNASGVPTLVGPTRYGSLFFGKKGAHIVPANPNQR